MSSRNRNRRCRRPRCRPISRNTASAQPEANAKPGAGRQIGRRIQALLRRRPTGSWRRQAASALAAGNCRAGIRPAARVEQSPGRDRRPIGSASAIGDRRFRRHGSASGSAGLWDVTRLRAAAWWNPLRVTLLVGTLVYLSGVVFRLPCRITVAGQPPPDHFKYLCYSDIGLLVRGSRPAAGPYALPRLR